MKNLISCSPLLYQLKIYALIWREWHFGDGQMERLGGRQGTIQDALWCPTWVNMTRLGMELGKCANAETAEWQGVSHWLIQWHFCIFDYLAFVHGNRP